MVLSDVSISISSPFSTDLITSTTFEFITAPKSNIVPIPASTVKTISDTDLAFGTYAGGTEKGTTVTYRVRKKTAYGGYTLIKEVYYLFSIVFSVENSLFNSCLIDSNRRFIT